MKKYNKDATITRNLRGWLARATAADYELQAIIWVTIKNNWEA